MTLRTVLIVVLALVFGGAAAVYATNAINRQRDERPVDRIPIVVARDTINPGKALSEGLMEIRNVPKDDLPEDVVHDMAELTRNGGRVTAMKVVKGAMIQKSMLLPEGAKEGMATLIRRKDKDDKEEAIWMQAATILTPTPSANVGGFILPGNFVDVMLTVDKVGGEGGGTIRLMQRVEVLAADTRTETNPSTMDGRGMSGGELRYVTLLVTPMQAQKLALAQKQGILTLILRNPEDTDPLPDTLVTSADILKHKPEEKKPEVRPVAEVKKEPVPIIRAFIGSQEYSAAVPPQ
jgi:pilus assembly protein CpaB